eukprot:7149-Heterococcus_DN1.PRE.2
MVQQLEKIRKHQSSHENEATRHAGMPVRLISSGGAVIGGVSGDTTPISSSLDTHGIEQARPDLWPPGATAHLERLVAARGDRMHCSWATVA